MNPLPIRKLYQFLLTLITVSFFYFQAEAGPAPLSLTLTEEGGCFYIPQGTAYSPTSDTPVEEAQCSCYSAGLLRRAFSALSLGALNWGNPIESGIYYGRNMWGDNWLIRGPSSKYEASSFDESANLKDCEQANPKRIYSNVTKQCYEDIPTCKEETQKGCSENNSGDLGLYWVNPASRSDFIKKFYNTNEENSKREEFKNCVLDGNSNEACLNQAFGAGLTSRKYDYSNIYRCNCEVPWYCGLIPGASCDKVCTMSPAGFSRLAFQDKVESSNPLKLLKIIVDTIFYFAVFLFIINMLSAGFDYLKSGGDQDRLKETKTRITNTIFGFVFILLIGGLLNYVVSILQEQIIIESSPTGFITQESQNKKA